MEVDANPRHGAGQRDNREQQQRVADRLRPSSDRLLPAITDVLSSATAISFTNDANSGRFQILKRWNDTILATWARPVSRRTSHIVVDEFLSLRSPALRLQGCWHRRDRRHRTRRPYLITVGDNAAGNTDSDAILAFRTRFLDVEFT